MHKSQIFIFFCGSFLLGVAVASITNNIIFYIIGCILILIIKIICKNARFYICTRISWPVFIASLIIYFLGIYCLRISYINENLPFDQEIKLTGIISNEPDERSGYTNYVLKTKEYKSKILMQTNNYPKYQYGDSLKVKCQLEKPKKYDSFDYGQYLAINDIYAICRQPSISVIANKQGNNLYFLILQIKQICQNKIEAIWAYPVSSFMAGLLLGLKKGLPKVLEENFRRTGTIHILVVSGSHLVIIAAFLKSIFKHIYLPRKILFYILLLILFIYVILTGMSQAAWRAWVMMFLILLAEYFGRPIKPFNILIITAFLMVLINPNILIFDTGFQLSLLATAGLLYLAKPLAERIKFIPNILEMRTLLAASIAAIIFTSPITIFQFKSFSFIAPLANLLIVPLITPIMIFGALILGLSFVSMPLAQFLGSGLELLVKLVIYLAETLANF